MSLFAQFAPSTRVLGAVAGLMLANAPAAFGQYIWKAPASQQGQWAAAARWTGGPDGTFPDSPDATATFDTPLSSAGTGNFNVQVSNTAGTNVTIGSVTVNHSDTNTFNTRFGANGNGTITLQSSTGVASWTENASPSDTTVTTSIFAPVIFASDTVITTNHHVNGNGPLSFGSTNNSPGGITAAPGITLTKEGPANVEFSVAPTAPGTGFQGNVVVNDGAVRVEDNVFANTASFTVNAGGQLQLASGALANWTFGSPVTLNGDGKSQGTNAEGALRFQNPNASSIFDSGINLASNSSVFVNADPPSPPEPATQSQLNLAGEVSGDGGLQKLGGGILELSAANSYSGGTTVDAGVLLASNATGSATGSGNVVVNAGGTLAGGGSIAGSVSIVDGILAPGTSAGTLSLGGLSLASGALLNFELDAPNVVGSGVNDLVVVGGNLTLDGTLAVSPLAGFGTGTYRLFDYTGSLSDLGLELSGIPAQFLAAIDLSVPGQVNLNVNPVPEPSSMILLGLGVAGIAVAARRRRVGNRESIA